ncbi:Aste57867_9854 [Aphanomyces stellatus]|uniref:Copper transport protein n=1 Tax=Aphanomyces stellatus TaxID=120398 RepID=A0A485KPJ9_9STRA|nr:hypothetical protein As57867_009815 [Aphanomyces stellatus]VFT86733.1 Aste57867_9854 [Aphanomyces stellatus]
MAQTCPWQRCVWIWLYLILLITDANVHQDLGETYCPICNMVVQGTPRQLLRGNQALYACEMAGHLQQLLSNPKAFVRDVAAVAALPAPYVNSTLQCPVCHDSHVTHAVELGPHGNQKIFACSEQHATTISLNPADVFIGTPENDTSVYCQGATIMYDGFQSAIHGVCPRLLFHTWVLNSEVKYAAGFLGIVLLGVLLEFWVDMQERLHRRLLRTYTETANADPADWDDNYSLEDKLLPSMPPPRRGLPLWTKAVLALSYMGIMTIAYFIMLVVMSYETGFFFAAIIGVGVGFFFFRDTDQLYPSGNPDPCCST